MDRPRLAGRRRIRVELRLPSGAADVLYRLADVWDVSLSDAGARLIELGCIQARDSHLLAPGALGRAGLSGDPGIPGDVTESGGSR